MRGKAEILRDLSGGLNNNLDPFGLPANQAADMCDVEPNGHSGLHRREGSKLFLVTVAQTRLLMYSQLRSNPVMGVSSNLRVGALVSAASGGTQVAAIEAPASGGQGPLYFNAGGGSTPFQWDGTTAGGGANWTAATGAVPAGNFMTYHGNRVIVAGVDANPSRVFASALQDPRNWGTGAGQGWQVDLDPNDGQGITGIVQCGPYLLVMKADKLYLIYDLDTGANRPLSQNVGGKAAVAAQGGAYVLAGDGIYFVTGESVRLISDALSPDIFSQRVKASKGGSYFAVNYRLAYVNGFLLAVPTLTTGPQDNYLYNERLGSWWKLQLGGGSANVNYAVGIPSLGSVISQTFMFPANLSVGNSQLETWAPHHEPYVPANATDGIGGLARALLATPFWKGSTMDMGTDLRKRIRQMDVEYETDAAAVAGPTLSLTRDDGSSATKALTGPATTVTTGRLLTPGVSKRWIPKVSGSDLWATHSLALRLQARKA